MIIELDQYDKYFHLRKLLQIPDCPERLYVEGNVTLLNNKDYKILCVIGSRKNTSYGRDAVEYLLRDIANEKIIILSGLALGIDGIAHKEALKNSLPTIAIPGSGLGRDILHPQTNAKLADDIVAQGGLLISEYENNFKATIWSFPKRNRIEAALSDAILIIESEAKSGTQITARMALEYNKNIGVLPGSIFSPMSVGTIKLWHEGAMPVCDAIDIKELLNIKDAENLLDFVIDKNGKSVTASSTKYIALAENYDNYNDLNDEEKKMMNILMEPMGKERLMNESGLDFTTALVTLVTLEGKGYIKEEWGEVRKVR